MAASLPAKAFSKLDLPAFGPTYNNRRNAVANEASRIRCGQEFIHSFQNRLQLIANLLARYVLNILLRIVDSYL